MSAFDPKTFASMTFTGANSTRANPIPAGEWPATVAKYEITAWESKKEPGKGGLKLRTTFEVADPAVEAVTGRAKSTINYDIMLDLTPQGGLDMGKGMNVRLGKLREALNVNNQSAPFSFDMMVGRAATLSVKHSPGYNDPQELVAEVSGVAKAA